MCHLFAHQPQRDYESQTRSLRIGGHCTSIRLEMSFWDTLEEIAAKEGMSLGKFLTTLHNEVLDHHGEVQEFCLAVALFLPDLSFEQRRRSFRRFATAPRRSSTPPNNRLLGWLLEAGRKLAEAAPSVTRRSRLILKAVKSLSSASRLRCSPPAGSRARRWSGSGCRPRRW